MDQVQGGYYQSYQPSYNSYQAPIGQWGGQSYNSQPTDQTYNYSNQSANNNYSNQSANNNYQNNQPYSYNTPKTYSTPCMGGCNPPKLYADTYNYLTENLMKPVIQEVYQDLKNITSANTVANHSLATKIGLNDKGQAQSIPEKSERFPDNAQS